MKKSDVARNPSYFDTYIDQVEDIDHMVAFQQSMEAIDALDLDKLNAIGDQVYAPGKWTVKDLIQHITDTERVFAYRALRFARRDKTALPGFDENLFAEHSGATRHSLEAILAELRSVRESSILLFKSFDEEALQQSGIMYKVELPVLAVAFTLLGHQVHHLRILEERYYPLAQS